MGRSVLVALLVMVGLAFCVWPATAAPPAYAVGRVYNKAVAANADILAADLTPFGDETPPYSSATVRYRVSIALVTTNSVVELQILDAANSVTVEADLTLADGSTTTLTAGKLYNFEIEAPRWAQSGAGAGTQVALSYNFHCETLTTVGFLAVDEVRN